MTVRTTDCVIGLGANLGDRRRTLERAVHALDAIGRRIALSPLYETRPLGPPQPDFLNAAVRLETALGPLELLKRLKSLEQELGRTPGERWGPRVLDLDVLYVVGLCLDDPGLVVPHPHLAERAFALAPLLDVLPEAVDPVSGEPYARTLARLGREGIRELEGSRLGAWLGRSE